VTRSSERIEELREKLAAAAALEGTYISELREAQANHPERMCCLQGALQKQREELENMIGEIGSCERDSEEASCAVKAAEGKLATRSVEAEAADAQRAALSVETTALMEQIECLRRAVASAQLAQDVRSRQLAEGMILARKLHNEYLSMKGNIRVFCRLRPRLSVETAEASDMRVDESSNVVSIRSELQKSVTGLSEHTNSWDFEFDHVFDASASQESIFDEIALLVQSAVDGYKVAIFAYGQTGSGKTYTMEGAPTAPATPAALSRAVGKGAGMIPRAVDLVFEEVSKMRLLGWSFEVQVTLVEVYNEAVCDLLPGSGAERRPTEGRTDEGRRVVVKDAVAVHNLLRRATRERHTAATASNDRSSRSHMIFQLSLLGSCEVDGHARELEGLLSFVDLAGSERVEKSGVMGERLREAQHINKSLSALGDVVEALARRGRGASCHVPYRNSRLTTLLKDSLGGDSKALMIVNVSPLLEQQSETVSSLRFAAKVHACTVGSAKRNVVERNVVESIKNA